MEAGPRIEHSAAPWKTGAFFVLFDGFTGFSAPRLISIGYSIGLSWSLIQVAWNRLEETQQQFPQVRSMSGCIPLFEQDPGPDFFQSRLNAR